MSSALLEAPGTLLAEAARRGRSHGGSMTLEERLQGAWHSLESDGAAECPLCHGRMTRVEGEGECRKCATRLS